MEGIMCHDENWKLPGRQVSNLPEFRPPDPKLTAREKKLAEIYGDDVLARLPTSAPSEAGGEGSSFLNGSAAPDPYPLNKMSHDHNNSSSCSSSNMDGSCNFSRSSGRGRWLLPLSSSSECLGSREVRHLQETRTPPVLPLTLPPDEKSNVQDPKSVQKRFDDAVNKIRRERNPDFSDIFGEKEASLRGDGDGARASILGKRNRSEAHKEINPTSGRSNGSHNGTAQNHDDVDKSARQRWYQDLLRSPFKNADGTEDTLYPIPLKPATFEDSEYPQRERTRVGQLKSYLFGRDLAPARPLAKVMLLRLYNLPEAMTHRDVAEAIRRFRCHVNKLWMPTNVLSGQHRGVASVILRQSCPNSDAPPTNASDGAEPAAKLIAWLEEQGVCVVAEALHCE